MSEKPKAPPYSGWKPRSMRMGKSRHESDRVAKRGRLGNRHDRALYKSAKGHETNPTRYAQLCRVACQMVYKRDTVSDKPVRPESESEEHR
jgi:hypothetical protein